MKLESPQIPEPVVAFAKTVAALADSHGLKGFTLTVRPFEREYGKETQTNGEMQFAYSVTDGRGRPCKRLSVVVSSTSTRDIIKDAESHS